MKNIFKYINKAESKSVGETSKDATDEDFSYIAEAVLDKQEELDRLRDEAELKAENERAAKTLKRMREVIRKGLGSDVSEETIDALISKSMNQ